MSVVPSTTNVGLSACSRRRCHADKALETTPWIPQRERASTSILKGNMSWFRTIHERTRARTRQTERMRCGFMEPPLPTKTLLWRFSPWRSKKAQGEPLGGPGDFLVKLGEQRVATVRKRLCGCRGPLRKSDAVKFVPAADKRKLYQSFSEKKSGNVSREPGGKFGVNSICPSRCRFARRLPGSSVRSDEKESASA